MEIKQQLRLTQQLVMTPQLQQAIKLLQLSRLELIDEVRKELDNNPVLSDEEPDSRGKEAADRRRAAEENPDLGRSDDAKPFAQNGASRLASSNLASSSLSSGVLMRTTARSGASPASSSRFARPTTGNLP